MSTLRQRRSTFKRSRSAVYLAAALGIGTFGFLMFLAMTAQKGLPGRSYYDLNAEFTDAVNLTKYSEVRLAGKRVGQVLSLDTDGGVARVRLQLLPGQDPLPVDTTARIRLKGLLGAKFVDLVPGTSPTTLRDGATIPRRQTSKNDDLIDTMQSLDAKRRSELKALLRTLGAGFASRGDDLNLALQDAPATLDDASRFAATLNAHPAALRAFVPSSDSAAAALDPVREDFAAGFEPGARALAPYWQRRGDVQATLEVGPTALAGMQRGLAQTDPLLAETAAFAQAAVRLARPAPRAFRSTVALLRESRTPLRTTRTLVRRLQRAVPPVLQTTRALDPLSRPLIRALRTSLGPLRVLGAARCDILGMARNWRSQLSYGPANSGGPLGPLTSLRVGIAITGDLVGDAGTKPSALVGRNPYAAPCASVTEKTGARRAGSEDVG